jgi:hypothetical protein
MSVRASVYIDEATLALLQSSLPAVSFEATPAELSFEQLAQRLRETSQDIEALRAPARGRRDFSKEVFRALSEYFSLVNLLTRGDPLDRAVRDRLEYNIRVWGVLKTLRRPVSKLLEQVGGPDTEEARNNFRSRLAHQLVRLKAMRPSEPPRDLARFSEQAIEEGDDEEQRFFFDGLGATLELFRFSRKTLQEGAKPRPANLLTKVLVVIQGGEESREKTIRSLKKLFELGETPSFFFVDELQHGGASSCRGHISHDGRPSCRAYVEKNAPYDLAVFRPFQGVVTLEEDSVEFVQRALTPGGHIGFMRDLSHTVVFAGQGRYQTLYVAMRSLGYEVLQKDQEAAPPGDVCAFRSFRGWEELSQRAFMYSTAVDYMPFRGKLRRLEDRMRSTGLKLRFNRSNAPPREERLLDEEKKRRLEALLQRCMDTKLSFLEAFVEAASGYVEQVTRERCFSPGIVASFYRLMGHVSDALLQNKATLTARSPGPSADVQEAHMLLESRLKRLQVAMVPIPRPDRFLLEEEGTWEGSCEQVVSMIERAWASFAELSSDLKTMLEGKAKEWLEWLKSMSRHARASFAFFASLAKRLETLLGLESEQLREGEGEGEGDASRDRTLWYNDSVKWFNLRLLKQTTDAYLQVHEKEEVCQKHFLFNFANLQKVLVEREDPTAFGSSPERRQKILQELRTVLDFPPQRPLPRVEIDSVSFSQRQISLGLDGEDVECTVRLSKRDCRSWKLQVALAYILGNVWKKAPQLLRWGETPEGQLLLCTERFEAWKRQDAFLQKDVVYDAEGSRLDVEKIRGSSSDFDEMLSMVMDIGRFGLEVHELSRESFGKSRDGSLKLTALDLTPLKDPAEAVEGNVLGVRELAGDGNRSFELAFERTRLTDLLLQGRSTDEDYAGIFEAPQASSRDPAGSELQLSAEQAEAADIFSELLKSWRRHQSAWALWRPVQGLQAGDPVFISTIRDDMSYVYFPLAPSSSEEAKLLRELQAKLEEKELTTIESSDRISGVPVTVTARPSTRFRDVLQTTEFERSEDRQRLVRAVLRLFSSTAGLGYLMTRVDPANISLEEEGGARAGFLFLFSAEVSAEHLDLNELRRLIQGTFETRLVEADVRRILRIVYEVFMIQLMDFNVRRMYPATTLGYWREESTQRLASLKKSYEDFLAGEKHFSKVRVSLPGLIQLTRRTSSRMTLVLKECFKKDEQAIISFYRDCAGAVEKSKGSLFFSRKERESHAPAGSAEGTSAPPETLEYAKFYVDLLQFRRNFRSLANLSNLEAEVVAFRELGETSVNTRLCWVSKLEGTDFDLGSHLATSRALAETGISPAVDLQILRRQDESFLICRAASARWKTLTETLQEKPLPPRAKDYSFWWQVATAIYNAARARFHESFFAQNLCSDLVVFEEATGECMVLDPFEPGHEEAFDVAPILKAEVGTRRLGDELSDRLPEAGKRAFQDVTRLLGGAPLCSEAMQSFAAREDCYVDEAALQRAYHAARGLRLTAVEVNELYPSRGPADFSAPEEDAFSDGGDDDSSSDGGDDDSSSEGQDDGTASEGTRDGTDSEREDEDDAGALEERARRLASDARRFYPLHGDAEEGEEEGDDGTATEGEDEEDAGSLEERARRLASEAERFSPIHGDEEEGAEEGDDGAISDQDSDVSWVIPPPRPVSPADDTGTRTPDQVPGAASETEDYNPSPTVEYDPFRDDSEDSATEDEEYDVFREEPAPGVRRVPSLLEEIAQSPSNLPVSDARVAEPLRPTAVKSGPKGRPGEPGLAGVPKTAQPKAPWLLPLPMPPAPKHPPPRSIEESLGASAATRDVRPWTLPRSMPPAPTLQSKSAPSRQGP